jgi:hypothetical protein
MLRLRALVRGEVAASIASAGEVVNCTLPQSADRAIRASHLSLTLSLDRERESEKTPPVKESERERRDTMFFTQGAALQ